MKGVRFCTFYDGRIKKLFMLDPNLINKIQVADFDHFTDLAFSPAEYIEVKVYLNRHYIIKNYKLIKLIKF